VTSALKNEAAVKTQKSSAIASLTQAQAQVEEAQQNLKYTTIVAAQPGRVVRLTGAKGQYLDAGQAIAMFVPDDVWITANFKETQLTDMRPGQLVNLTIDAYPDHKLTGKIDSIQPGSGTAFSLLPAENATGNYVKVTQRVPVKIVVDHWPSDVAIGPGMSVVPTVTVRPRN
jgi:membrane fusion protein (multidrug efflux system)